VTADPLSFFTVDRGTASTAAALIAPFGDRFRLLGTTAAPSGVPVELLLEDLTERVHAADPDALPSVAGWADWARLEAATHLPPACVCVAGSERRLVEVEQVVADAGWEITGRVLPDRPDAAAAMGMLFDRRTRLVIVAGGPAGEDRTALATAGALVRAALARRGDLTCIALGAAGDALRDVAPAQLVRMPAVGTPVPDGEPSLHDRLLDAAEETASGPAPSLPSARVGLRRATASLAALLDRRIETVEVGHGAGSRVVASPTGVVVHAVRADGALVPHAALTDDRLVDGILRWSAVRGDAFALRDRLRNLWIAPWRDGAGDGARLRLAAARAALGRLEGHRPAERTGLRRTAVQVTAPEGPPSDLVVASGGAFSSVPPPAAALALADGLRRAGAMSLVLDHARLLAPIGTLADESDRRRLLADLLDDALLPLGSVIVAGGLRPGRHAGTLRVRSPLGVTEVELVPGTLRSVDLPPGVTATAELETREGVWLGVRARHVALQVTGGLGGLLVDTREVPLRLPERSERRRALIESWERPMWVGADG
jgi:hypothetical protein